MSAVREANFPPTSPSAAASIRTAEIVADASTLFRNLDELARMSPAGARMILGRIAAELAKRAEGKA